MIGFIQGRVEHLSAPLACVLTASGVGYDIELPVPVFCRLHLHEDIQLWTHLHVREDAQLLYGFIERQDRETFRQLIKINGVGAKMALAMLSNMSVIELKQCVDSDDEQALVRIPGIGKKTAQRLLIELKDKLKNIQVAEQDLAEQSEAVQAFDTTQKTDRLNSQLIAEVTAALTSLGYKAKEADQAIKLAKQSLNWNDASIIDMQTSLQVLLKASLRQLAR